MEKADYEPSDKSIKNRNYKDRASERRDKFGVDLSHIDNAAKSNESGGLDKGNIGLKMLEKMGWKEGEGLGKSKSGIVEPIKATMRAGRSGLGSGTEYPIEKLDESRKIKINNWNKANKRFQAATLMPTPKVFCIDDDDDDDVIKIDVDNSKR